MAKLIDITGRALSGEWGIDLMKRAMGFRFLGSTNFTNEGVVNYNDVITRTITKKNIDADYVSSIMSVILLVEKSGGKR